MSLRRLLLAPFMIVTSYVVAVFTTALWRELFDKDGE